MQKNIVLAAAMFVLAFMATGCEEEAARPEPVRPVRVFRISDQGETENRSFPGKVEAARSASLAFRVSGQIVRFDVKEGDKVEQGQLIAQLDQRDLVAAVADLEAKLAGARSVLNEARLNIERNKTLLAEHIIAQSAYDTALSTFETSRAEALSLEQSLKRARLNLQYTRLEAPFSGTIAMKNVENHEYVQAKEAIVQLEDTSSLDIVLDVPENVWVRAFKGGTCTLASPRAMFETFPGREFPLTLKEFQTKANAETQTYEVTLSMENPDMLGVNPGMTAEVMGAMPDNGHDASVSVPFSAVTGVPDGAKYVWVVQEDGSVRRTEVEVGQVVNDMFEIRNGLDLGDAVVLAGVHYLHDGQKVRVLDGRIGSRE